MPAIPIDERVKLQELTHLYAKYVDSKQPEKVVELYTEDGVMDESGIGYPAASGKANLLELFTEGFRHVGSMVHYVTNHLITDYTGKTAKGECLVYAEARTLDGDPIRVFGYYDDVYEKVNGEWRFQSRHVRAIIPPELALR